MLRAVTRTSPGKVRTNNEDLALWDPELGVVALADGMGGHNAGEVASKLAIETFRSFLHQSALDPDVTWTSGYDATATRVRNLVRTAVALANREVFRSAEEDPARSGMGTTFTAAVVEGGHVTYAHVGDTRLYVMHGRALRQVTTDDSIVGALGAVPGVDPALLEHHPMRNVLTNALGRRPEIDAAIAEFDLEDGDLVLLSTDGMHGAVPHDSIQSILNAEPDLDRAADLLVHTALELDGRDNITVVLASYQAV